MDNQDRYNDLEDEVYNILLDFEDAEFFPTLYIKESGTLDSMASEYAEIISLQDAIAKFGAHEVGEVCRLNISDNNLNKLLNELDELSDNE